MAGENSAQRELAEEQRAPENEPDSKEELELKSSESEKEPETPSGDRERGANGVEAAPSKKAAALKARMKALKLKMNQARQLNQQEVMREGERLGSIEGANKARQQQKQRDKRLQKEEWEARNSAALQVASQAGIDGKHMVQQADASLNKARRKAEAADENRFSSRDYHNPEGQHRNYQQNLKALARIGAPAGSDREPDGVFDPTAININGTDEARERDGAHRLAQEMHRRIEKQAKKKRDRMEYDETDVSYINLRNKRFNEKINRNFDKHTAEIRQNLERGTAL